MSSEKTEKNITAEGTYNARAINGTVNWGKSAKGIGQVGLTFEITSEGPYKGRRLPWYGSFAEGDAVRITLEALEGAGANLEAIIANEPTIEGLGDSECSITVKHKPLQTYVDGVLVDKLDEESGEVIIVPSVAFVNKLGGAAFKTKLDEKDASSLTNSIGALVAARKGGKVPVGADGKPLF
jgi:hypothetical protein